MNLIAHHAQSSLSSMLACSYIICLPQACHIKVLNAQTLDQVSLLIYYNSFHLTKFTSQRTYSSSSTNLNFTNIFQTSRQLISWNCHREASNTTIIIIIFLAGWFLSHLYFPTYSPHFSLGYSSVTVCKPFWQLLYKNTKNGNSLFWHLMCFTGL